MRKTSLAIVTAATFMAASIATPTKAEANCYGCWVGGAFAVGLIGSAIATNQAYGYGYGPGYYGGYAPTYYAPTYYAPAYNYGYAPAYNYGYAAPYYGYRTRYAYPRRHYGYGYGRPYRANYGRSYYGRGAYYGPRRYANRRY